MAPFLLYDESFFIFFVAQYCKNIQNNCIINTNFVQGDRVYGEKTTDESAGSTGCA